MNRVYRSVWNHVTRTFVAAAEHIRSRGKQVSSSRSLGSTEDANPVCPAATVSPATRRRPAVRPLALEPRFMFDGAAVDTALHDAQVVQANNAASPLLANGDFEADNVSGWSYQRDSGAPFTDWIFAGQSGLAGNGSPWFQPDTPSGGQAAFLQTDDGWMDEESGQYNSINGDGVLSQSLNLDTPGRYQLTFQAVGRRSYGAVDIAVLLDGAQVGSVAASSQSTEAWQPFSFNFTIPGAGEHTLTLKVATPQGSGDHASAIDDVQLALVTAISAPTFTAFSQPVASGLEDSTLQISLANLLDNGNEADSQSTVSAFVVKAVSSGSLKIGTDAGSATAWAAGSNNVIDATHHAFWTAARDANGNLNAFTVVARNADGGESSSPVQAKVSITAVNDVPNISGALTQSATEGGSNVSLNLMQGANDPDSGSSATLTLQNLRYQVDGVATGNGGTDLPAGLSLVGNTLTLNPAHASFDSVADGATRTVELRYQIRNESGGTVNQSATFSVAGVNDSPVLATTALTLPGMNFRDHDSAGFTIASMIAGAASDADNTALVGIALSGTSGSNGKWQYKGGDTWQDVGTVSETQALLLRPDDRLRFVPDGTSGTTASLNFFAWDQSRNTADLHGTKVNLGSGSLTQTGLTGTSGANLFKLAAVGGYVYGVGDGWSTPSLRTIDARNPSAPQQVNTDTLTENYGVTVNGNYVYVADGAAGLRIFSIANPADPQLVGTYDSNGSGRAVAVSGNYAYLADDTSGLKVVDISNKSAPALVGSLAMPNQPLAGIQVSGHYAFIATKWGHGLRVVDISNPSAPVEVGSNRLTGETWSIGLSGNYAYLGTHWGQGVRVVDISNPANPVEVGSLLAGKDINDLTVSGNVLFATTNDGLSVFSLNNRRAPELIETLAGAAGGVAVADGQVYVATTSNQMKVASLVTGIGRTTSISAAQAVGQLTVTEVNAPPTLSAFAAPVATGDEDTAIAVTFAGLRTQGNEADIDGSVSAFVVKTLSSGSLKIGADAATATAWAAGSNDTIDATHQAFWTPAQDANGTLNAFTVVARDNSGTESASPVQTTVSVTPVDDAPTLLSATPADNSSDVAIGSSVVLRFSSAMQAGSGNIRIVNNADPTDTRSIAANSAQVVIAGDTVTVTPASPLKGGGVRYHVLIEAGALRDAAGSDFPGISSSTVLDFTTRNTAPTASDDERIVTASANPVLNAGDFGNFADADSQSLAGIRATSFTLPSGAALQYDAIGNGTWQALTAAQQISLADLNAGRLRYVAPAGSSVATLRFQVSDGLDYSSATYTLTLRTANTDAVTAATNPNVEVKVSTGTGQLNDLTVGPVPTNVPANISLPLGEFSFNVTGLAIGGTATITLTVDSSAGTSKFFKQSWRTGIWRGLGSAITSGGVTRLSFALQDGGEYDADRTANGVIVDPGILAYDNSDPQVVENTRFVANLSNALDISTLRGSLSYTIDGGADAARFEVDTDGTLRFRQAPNFELPGSAASSNTYAVSVSATGSAGGTASRTLNVAVINDNGLVDGISDLSGDLRPIASATPANVDAFQILANNQGLSGAATVLALRDNPDDPNAPILVYYDGGHLEIAPLEGKANGSFLVDTGFQTTAGGDGTIAGLTGGDGVISAGELIAANGIYIGRVDSQLDGQNGRSLRINFLKQDDPVFQTDYASLASYGTAIDANSVGTLINSLQYRIDGAVPNRQTFALSLNNGSESYESVSFGFYSAGGPAAPSITGITNDSGTAGDGVTNDNTLSLSGTAVAGSTVHIYRNGNEIGTTVATNGHWTFDYTGTTLADSDYLFTARAEAANLLGDVSATYKVTVDAINNAPTFTAFSNPLANATEDTEKLISFADLSGVANAADSDGSVTAFIVKSVTTGTLKIGTDAATATAWAVGSNDAIDATHHAFWTPARDANGTLNAFTVVARDNNGAESSQVQAQVSVTPANDAPTLNAAATPTLSAVQEDAPVPTGTLGNAISDLLNGTPLGNFADIESDQPGIAITGVNPNGTLYYSTNGGSTWAAVGSVSAASARLLYADANTRLYFKPTANFNDNLADALTFKAWDRTGGYTNGQAGIDTLGGQAQFQSLATVQPSAALAHEVTISGHYAIYANAGDGVRIVDIANPASPVQVGQLNTAGYAWSVARSGNYVYVADDANGLLVLNVADPAHPTLVETMTVPGDRARTVTVSDNRLYVTHINSGRVRIYDLANPEHPTFLAQTPPIGASDIAVNGNRLYAVGYSGISIHDISNPAAVQALTGYFGPSIGTAVAYRDGYIYVGTYWVGLTVIDVRDPAAWRTVYTLPGDAKGLAITLDGNHAYVADANAIRVYDIANPENISLQGIRSGVGGGGLAVSGDVLLLGAEDQGLNLSRVSFMPAPSSFSVNSDTVALSVLAVNDAPSLSTGQDFIGIDEDARDNAGQTVASLATGITDIDGATPFGIALIAAQSGNGQWQYRLAGSANWLSLPAVSEAQALLLGPSDRLRFVPDGHNGSQPNLGYRAWDGSAGQAGERVDTRNNGGNSAFSAATTSARLVVTDVNDAPTGSVVMSGQPIVGQTLSVSQTLADVDLGVGTVTYTWHDSDGRNIGTGSSLKLTQAQVGKTVTVTASYTDGKGMQESVHSAPSTTVLALPTPLQPVLTPPPSPSPIPSGTAPDAVTPKSSPLNFVQNASLLNTPVSTPQTAGIVTPPTWSPNPGIRTMPASPATSSPAGETYRPLFVAMQGEKSDTLFANRPTASLDVPRGGGSLTVPGDVFIVNNPAAQVKLTATLPNGDPLPAWISFDGTTGKFTVKPPPGVQGVLEIRLQARDGQDSSADVTLQLNFAPGNTDSATEPALLPTDKPQAGRPGLSEKLRLAKGYPGKAINERLGASAQAGKPTVRHV